MVATVNKLTTLATLARFRLIPRLTLFLQLIRQPLIEDAAVIVEQHRNLAAIAVVPVAVLGVEVPHLFGGVNLAVSASVPGSRRWLERRQPQQAGIQPQPLGSPVRFVPLCLPQRADLLSLSDGLGLRHRHIEALTDDAGRLARIHTARYRIGNDVGQVAAGVVADDLPVTERCQPGRRHLIKVTGTA